MITITCANCGTINEATVRHRVDEGDKRPDLASGQVFPVWTCNVCEQSWTDESPDYRALARRLARALEKSARAMAGSARLQRETDAVLADPAVQALNQGGLGMMVDLWLRRIGLSLGAAAMLPIYLLGAGVAGFAVGIGRGLEAWAADMLRYWKAWRL